MASQPIANPSIDWSSRNLGQEYTTFMEMCKLMFTGPYKKCTDSEQFSYMVLWGGSKALTLWMNSGNTEQTVSKFTEVMKLYCVPTDRQFWASRMEMRHMSQRPGETFQDYSARVITLGDLCKWSNRDEQIVCSLIFGANHREAQRKALNKPSDLSVKNCIDHFVSFEATDNYHKSINTSVPVNSVQKKQYYNDNQSLSNKPTFIKKLLCMW